jgi:3'-phosphoadenosine 5'-phosphosulfate sulfotransferase (PAPS reductase)/FAD synthetase
MITIKNYDHYIVAFSGGKDSTAAFLHLLECGVPKHKIELWHHDIDGREGSTLMDWQVTPAYCRAFAKAFDVPLYFSWKVGGFEREMLRDKELTAPTRFEVPGGYVVQVGGSSGKASTRRMFPQVSADLSVRWCSAYLKIDVCSAAIRNQDRFNNKRTLLITGERAQESSARAKYNVFEPDRADAREGVKKRHVDHWRPIHGWMEDEVWEIIEYWRVNVHPAYHLGWGRVSCAACIFGSPNQWRSLFEVDPGKVSAIARYEEEFGKTIHRSRSVLQQVDIGKPYPASANERYQEIAKGKTYDEPIFIKDWKLPAGAYGESCGPS